MVPFAILLAVYDQLRFGSPFDTGYALLATGDPFFEHGLFSLLYLPRHFYAMLMQAPEFVDGTLLFARPHWWGVSLLLTSPAFVFAFAARGRPEVAPLALAAALPLLLDALHGTTGFAQFGYRFSLDAQAFALPLLAIGACWRDGAWRPRPPGAYRFLIVWSALANLYGVLVISFLGYVS